MFIPSVNPKDLSINLRTVTHLNPLDQELLMILRESRGHPVGFLVPVLVL